MQNAGWVNNELQNYVDGVVNGKRVTELSDGKLRIHCFKGDDGKIYSGRVYAHESEGWQYGYIEARMMLPKGKGTWPAFWMMPCNVDWNKEGWPKCGEIDIMEEVGVVPNEVSSSLHAEGHNHTNGTQVTHAMTIEKAEGEFHTYAIEWTAQNITTYVMVKFNSLMIMIIKGWSIGHMINHIILFLTLPGEVAGVVCRELMSLHYLLHVL